MEDKPLSVQVYEKIKHDIISLKYQPSSILKERELSETLGVSRTPIREAIQRLSQEGWLVPGDGKRLKIRPVTLADVYEIIQIRNIIEYSAIDLLLECGETRVLAGRLDMILEDMKKSSEEYQFTSLDLQFHRLLVLSMKNARIEHFWNTIQEEILRMALLVIRGKDRWDGVIMEHEQLVNALWNKDPGQIKEAMRNHLEHSYESLIRNLEKHMLNS